MSDVTDKELLEPESFKTAEEPAKTDYLEFVGTGQYGTEFYGQRGTHVVTAKQLKEAYDVDLGVKEAVWKRGKNQRFLVPVADLNAEAVEALEKDPMFKRVSI